MEAKRKKRKEPERNITDEERIHNLESEVCSLKIQDEINAGEINRLTKEAAEAKVNYDYLNTQFKEQRDSNTAQIHAELSKAL